jgi:hypothetical protein
MNPLTGSARRWLLVCGAGSGLLHIAVYFIQRALRSVACLVARGTVGHGLRARVISRPPFLGSVWLVGIGIPLLVAALYPDALRAFRTWGSLTTARLPVSR